MGTQVVSDIIRAMSLILVSTCAVLLINKTINEIWGTDLIKRFMALFNRNGAKKDNKKDNKKATKKDIKKAAKTNIKADSRAGRKLDSRKDLRLDPKTENIIENEAIKAEIEKDQIEEKNSTILKNIFFIYVINRLILFVGTYLFAMVHENKCWNFLLSFEDIWRRWDSNGYIRIAQNWYQNTNGDVKYDIAWYPLYPLLTKIMSIFVRSYFYSGVLVSNIMLIIGLYFLYKLLKLEFANRRIATDAVRYVLIFPFSFFFSIMYTESTFLTLSILTVYFARKNKWLVCGLFGLLASFSRNQGILLTIPIFIEFMYSINIKEYIKQRKYSEIFKKLLQVFGTIGLVFCGVLMYLVVNKMVYGNWFQFLIYQKENWSQQFGFFAQNLGNNAFDIVNRDTRLALGAFLPNVIIFFASIILLISTIRKIRLSYAIFSLAYIIVSFSPTWLLSGPRYITGMFTLYLMLAVAFEKDKTRKFVEYLLLMLLFFYAFLFYIGSVY